MSTSAGLLTIKAELENLLRRVMVRTERLALRADRNGMLQEVISENVRLTAGDLQQYFGLQRVAREVEHAAVLEYWKSAPYLLNFMEDYALRRQLNRAIERRPVWGMPSSVCSTGRRSCPSFATLGTMFLTGRPY